MGIDTPKFSFKKNLAKGLYAVLGSAIFLIAFTQFADIDLWTLVETYAKPVLQGLTIVGVLRMAQNAVKFQLTK